MILESGPGFQRPALDAKVTVEMKGRVAKGAFLKKFRGHREHIHWKEERERETEMEGGGCTPQQSLYVYFLCMGSDGFGFMGLRVTGMG